MQNFLRFVLLAGLVASTAFAQSRISDIVARVDTTTIPVRVAGASAELNGLARQAFGVHGRYRLVESGFKYDIRFSAAGPNQVRVDVLGPRGADVVSQVVSGATTRVALLRAADVAVEHTNEMGLRGFFTARLAFVAETTGKKEVYVSDLFLGEMKRVTNDRALVITPRWSPDGQRLLYTSFFKSGFPDIFQYDLRTYERTTFVSFRGTNQGARYSPNGTQVAMVLSGEGSSEIYVGNARGTGIARRNVGSSAVKASPCWSPDGSRIVFAMGDATPQLYVIPAAGGGAQRLRTGYSYAAEPDWSRAQPNKIACTVKDGGSYQIAVYDFAKGKAEKVSAAPFDGIEPCWLADGRHLVYTARDRSSSVLCILDTESGKSTRISTGVPAAVQANVWTP
jgi:TolB protein